jgi:hypothetical protein
MTIEIRNLTEDDIPALQKAIEVDTFHPGEWKVEDFLSSPDKPPVATNVIEDQNGPIAFVRYTKTLRISCVWNDGADVSRNARAIIQGIHDAVLKARASGFSEIIITTSHSKLATFFERVMKMTKSGDEYLLAV